MVHYISSCRGQIQEMPIYLTIDRYVGLIKNLRLRPNAAIVLVSLSAAPFHRCVASGRPAWRKIGLSMYFNYRY